MRVFVDANLIVEAAVSQVAADRLDRELAGHVRVTSSVVLGEVFVALTRRKGRPHGPLMPPPAAEAAARAAAKEYEVVPVSADDALEALAVRGGRTKGYWDALHWVCARRAKCERVEGVDDPGGPILPGVEFHNPLPADYLLVTVPPLQRTDS